jgi:hypothetical protein
MSERVGRWRGEVDNVHGPHEALFLIGSAPATFMMSRGTPSALPHQQDEYTVAADFRDGARRRYASGGLREESIQDITPSVPDFPVTANVRPESSSRHRRGETYAVRATSVLSGLHHEYSLAPAEV